MARNYYPANADDGWATPARPKKQRYKRKTDEVVRGRTTMSASCQKNKHDKCTSASCECPCGHGVYSE